MVRTKLSPLQKLEAAYGLLWLTLGAFLVLVIISVTSVWLWGKFVHSDNHGDPVIEDAIGQAYASNDVIIKLNSRFRDLDTRAEQFFGAAHRWQPDDTVPKCIRDWTRYSKDVKQEEARVIDYLDLVERRQKVRRTLDSATEFVDQTVTNQTKDATPDRVLKSQRVYANDLRAIDAELDKCFDTLDA